MGSADSITNAHEITSETLVLHLLHFTYFFPRVFLIIVPGFFFDMFSFSLKVT